MIDSDPINPFYGATKPKIAIAITRDFAIIQNSLPEAEWSVGGGKTA